MLSPSNSAKEMADKLAFYDLYGVAEYYLYDPSRNDLRIWLRRNAKESGAAERGRLVAQSHVRGWTSPRLGIRFAVTPETLDLFYPSGQPFLTSVQLARRAELETERATRAQARAEEEAARAEQEAARAENEAARATAEQARADRLAERSLRAQVLTRMRPKIRRLRSTRLSREPDKASSPHRRPGSASLQAAR